MKFGSVTELPYGDGDFDVVSIMDVIQMITEDEQRAAVGEALRVLRPGGLLIVNVCALEWLRGQHDEANGVRTRFTKAGLEALWREGARSLGCGLEVLGCGYRVGLLLPAVAAVKLGKRLLRPMAAEAVSDQGATPGFANGPLSAVMAAENGLLAAGLPMPWGSSAFLVGRRG